MWDVAKKTKERERERQGERERERKENDPMPTQLTQEEIDSCRDAFLQYDKDRSGTIDQWELKEVLEGK